jgi:hypothetical protein
MRACIRSLLLAAAGLAAGLALASPAEAASCSTLPNPVYVAGSGKLLVQNLATVLAPTNVTIVYLLQGSCITVGNVLNDTPLAVGMATYWDAGGTAAMCDLDANIVPDVGISDVFPSTCMDLPNGLGTAQDAKGPIEGYVFAVPKASTQKVIHHDAAYMIFGFGKDSGVDPWTDEALMFNRGAGSGTQQMMAAAIGVPATQWKGTTAASSDAVVSSLSTAMNAEAAIGILTAESALKGKLSVEPLAYQDVGQECGYWMDSAPGKSDKKNLRDGHYTMWGPIHFITKSTMKPAAKQFVNYAVGTLAPPNGLDLISILAAAGLVPQCAMKVTRDSEMGPLMSFQPERSCACYFDSLVGTTDCQACKTDTECPTDKPKCNYNFCEEQ